MTFVVRHRLVNTSFSVTVDIEGDTATVRAFASGAFTVGFPGVLDIDRRATYSVRSTGGGAGGGGEHTQSLPLTLEIRTPDGQPFTGDAITLVDLRLFRDLRGVSHGAWSYTVQGERPIVLLEPITGVNPGRGHLSIAVVETVASQSAAPLVDDRLDIHAHRRYTFDLYRVGTFTATALPTGPFGHLFGDRQIALLDPDGVVVASGDNSRLSHPITLADLGKSRDAGGQPRRWALDVFPAVTPGGESRIRATVVETARINTAVLQDRITFLLGEGGSKISIFGEHQGSDILARLKIKDILTAETVDLRKLLDSAIRSVPQDPGINTDNIDINTEDVYTLARRSRDLPHEMHVTLNDLRVSTIDVAVGASEQIQPSTPAVKLGVGVEGDATIKLGGLSLARVKVRGNHLRVEAGVRTTPDGSLESVTWVEPDPLDIDVSWEVVVATGVVSLLSLGAAGVAELIEEEFNHEIREAFERVVGRAIGRAPQILAVMLGAAFTFRSVRLDGDDILLDYIAPVEPDPRPNPAQDYLGIVGRSATQLGPNAWQLTPPTVGDTWAADNLARIEHIVVVMMENRSHDHVLGYLAQQPGLEGSDGLTPALMTFLAEKNFKIPKLGALESGIPANSLGFRTRLPVSVGHSLEDVAQQLGSEPLTTPEGRAINSPRGFLDNFANKLAIPPEVPVEDVLGFYEAGDLRFFAFLVKNYAYCEQYYCSHPGPTLPNRMFWLTGDVQYDRTGEAILNNNRGDNFVLSRARTIFDVLTGKGVDWRVYESFPSLAMLRFFARYATDNTKIVNIDASARSFVEGVSRFHEDVAQGNLPPVTFVEPAMHHFPPTDDHPPADMYRGQEFLKSIYDALFQSQLWPKTLLLITYDEHGGLYDHVIPPLAEARMRPPLLVEEGAPPPPPPFTPDTVTTPYGVRVPTFVVSPWAPAGKGPDGVLDHCSTAKTILARFCPDRPFLSDRIRAARSFNAYLSAPEPRLEVERSPALQHLPDEEGEAPPAVMSPSGIATPPVFSRDMRRGNVDYHDLTGMLGRLLGR